jgi:glycosyltransferase involved in cell wall biosynthesis
MTIDSFCEIADYTALPEKPVVSVLMITYNHEKFISQAIEAILAQETDFPFELLIGEDHSTDGTLVIAQNYQKIYPGKIRLIFSESNVGVNRNFARVHARSSGIYIAYCEGDDYWGDKNKLQKQVDFLQRNDDYVAAYHDAVVVDSLGVTVDTSLLKDFKTDYLKEELVMTAWMPTLTLLHRNVIKEYPLEFFKVINADAFNMSLFGGFGRAKYLSNISPSYYRVHSGGVWSARNEAEMRIGKATTLYWLSQYYRRIGEVEISDKLLCGSAGKILQGYTSGRTMLLKWATSIAFPYALKIYRDAKKSLFYSER